MYNVHAFLTFLYIVHLILIKSLLDISEKGFKLKILNLIGWTNKFDRSEKLKNCLFFITNEKNKTNNSNDFIDGK